MTRPWLALALLLAAGLVHVGVTLPARRSRDLERAEFARQREAREHLRVEIARLERRAASVRATAPDDDAAAARALRLALLEATRGLELGDVRIAAQPERQAGVAARGRLGGNGSQAELLRAAGRLAQPSSGVLLERVVLTQGPLGIRLEADAVTLRAGS